MNNEKLVASFTAFANSKNIDRPTVISMLDDVLRTLLKKKFGTSENFHIVINPEKGDLQIWRYREIVEDDAEDADNEEKIPLSQARKLEPDFEVGEEVAEEIDLQIFGRRAITQGLKLLSQKIQEIEREGLYNRYKTYEGELIYAEVYYLTSKVAVLHDTEKNDLILPKENQIPNERYKKGSHIHAIIDNVNLEHNRLNIILSRTSNLFLEKTLENQIDEISDGIVKIRKVVRRPGRRAKVVVSTEDDRIDPVGACVGSGGQRIKNISRREFWNEQIDIISHTDNDQLFIKRALAPAQVNNIQITDDRIAVYLKPDQVPLAIGVEGQNIDLASKLIGKPIDVYREITPGQEKSLEELSPEISNEIIEKLISKGFKTIDAVLQTSKEKLKTQTDLAEEEIDALYTLIIDKYAIRSHSLQTQS